MTNSEFFHTSSLQYRLQAANQKLEAFESGDKYIQMKKEFASTFRAQNRTISELKSQLGKAHRETITVRKYWSEVFDDVDQETSKALALKDAMIEKLTASLLEAGRQRDAALDKARDKNTQLYNVMDQLYEAEEKIKALTARLNKDYTNSSKPSSQSPNHKAIPNGRIKSGKKPGGQKGHIHNGRKEMEPTSRIEIPAPEHYTNDPNFKPTGNEIKKQLVCFSVNLEVIEYTAAEFRNQATGQRVHADFPEGIKDDVTYDGTVKALAYLLNNECYVSIGKTKAFLHEISDGQLSLSTGMICNLSRQFSEKTIDERNDIFLKLMASPTMHSDFTFGRMNGKQSAVIICAADDMVLYQGRAKKGDEGVKGSPLEFYEGTNICDHEAALIKHGSRHQECMQHVDRYAISSIENEKDLTWNRLLREWIKDAFEYWWQVRGGEEESPEIIATLDKRYDEIMEKAKTEYEYIPPSKSFPDGYNLYKRMALDKDSYTLFIHDNAVDPTNNLAERSARKFKRKAAQVMCFRSQDGVDYFCDGLTMTETIKASLNNLYQSVSTIFNKGIKV